MKVKITHLKYFGVKESEITEEIFFVEKLVGDPLWLEFQFKHGESVRVRQSHLISIEIESDPETLIL